MKIHLKIIAEELFQVSLATYMVLLSLETVKEGFVNHFFNLNLLLTIVFLSGIFMMLAGSVPKYIISRHRVKENLPYMVAASAVGGGLIYVEITRISSSFAIIIAAAAFFVIFFLSYFILTKDKDSS